MATRTVTVCDICDRVLDVTQHMKMSSIVGSSYDGHRNEDDAVTIDQCPQHHQGRFGPPRDGFTIGGGSDSSGPGRRARDQAEIGRRAAGLVDGRAGRQVGRAAGVDGLEVAIHHVGKFTQQQPLGVVAKVEHRAAIPYADAGAFMAAPPWPEWRRDVVPEACAAPPAQ